MLEVMEMVYRPKFGVCIKAGTADRPRAWGERGLEVEESRIRVGGIVITRGFAVFFEFAAVDFRMLAKTILHTPVWLRV